MARVAYRAIRSRRVFVNADKVRRELERTFEQDVKPHFIKEFEKVVQNWEHQPEFKARKYISGDDLRLAIYPSGPNKEIYKFVTGGTKPHTIRPRRAKMLAFMWGGPGSYKPKTTPQGGYGGPGTVMGGKLTFAKAVQHPGTKPRNIEKRITKEQRPWFNRTMENAWRRGLRAMRQE